MRPRIGKLRTLAILGAILAVATAVAAWSLWSTNGLLFVLLIVVMGVGLATALLIVRTEKRQRLLVANVRSALSGILGTQHERLDAIESELVTTDGQLQEVVVAAAWQGEQWDRLLTAVDARLTRVELAQQHGIKEVAEAVHSDSKELSRLINELSERDSKHVTTASNRLFRQVEALAALYADVRPPSGFPPTRGWAASPDLLVYLYETVRNRRPQLVVECGSGLSTFVIAYGLKRNGEGRVVALEHLPEFRDSTQEWISDHGLEDWVDIRLAAVEPIEINGQEWLWYDKKAIPSEPIDLLFVDGPPAKVGKNARFPALPLMAANLREGGLVILDDTSRPDESSIAESWATAYPSWEMEQLAHEKGSVAFVKRTGE